MNRLIIALALTPALFVTGASAQSVTDDVTKQLWCGTALSVAFATPPDGLTAEQATEAQGFLDGGTGLLETATKAHLDAGFTEEAVNKLKADLVAEVTPVVTGEVQEAKFTFEECIAILPAAPDAASSSSAM
jgi:hypothetical protein